MSIECHKKCHLIEINFSTAICRDWLSRCTDITTLHGFPWYNRFESIAVKAFIIVACFGFFCAMSGYAIYEILVWYHSKVRLTSETIKVVNELQYPNITLCHSKYFDMSKAEGNFLTIHIAKRSEFRRRTKLCTTLRNCICIC